MYWTNSMMMISFNSNERKCYSKRNSFKVAVKANTNYVLYKVHYFKPSHIL